MLLKDIYIHPGPQLKSEQSAIHADLMSSCIDRLRVSHDNLTVLDKHCKRPNSNTGHKQFDKLEEENDEIKRQQEITQILRVMVVLRECLNEFDANYLYERFYPPSIV